MRLMQRREGNKSRKVLDDLICQQQRRKILGAAVNNAVSHSRDVAAVKPLGAYPQHRLSCCGMVEALIVESFLDEGIASRIQQFRLWRCPYALDLAAE